MSTKLKILKTLIASLLIISVFLGFAPSAHAGWLRDFWEGAKSFVADGLKENLAGAAFYAPAYGIWTATGLLFKGSAKLIDTIIQSDFQNFTRITVIVRLWNTVRDVVNMLFILTLLITAFGTLFNIQKFTAGELLPKIIISALLINFSLVIGQVIIDMFNFLTFAILQAVGEPSARFGELARVGELIPSPENATGGWLSAGVEYILLSIFNILGAIGLFLGAIFALIRVPVLGFLLVFSPLAWLTYILPQTRGFFSIWWKKFLYWCYFLPLYVFFLYLGFTFMEGGRASIISQISTEQTGFGALTQQSLSTFILGLLTLYGGFYLTSKLGGTGATVTVGAVTGAFGAARFGARKAYSSTGAAGAVKRIREQIRREGIRGIGGEKRLEARELKLAAGVAKPFGEEVERGVKLEAEAKKLRRIKDEKQKLDESFAKGEIDLPYLSSVAQGHDEKAYAAKMTEATNGEIDGTKFRNDLKELDPTTPKGKAYFDLAIENAQGDLKKEFPDIAAGRGTYQSFGATIQPVSVKVIEQMTKDKELHKLDGQTAISAHSILGRKGTKAQEDFYRNLAKTRVDLFAHAEKIKDPRKNPASLTESEKDEIADVIKDKIGEENQKRGNSSYLMEQNRSTYEAETFQRAIGKMSQDETKLEELTGLIKQLEKKGETAKVDAVQKAMRNA